MKNEQRFIVTYRITDLMFSPSEDVCGAGAELRKLPGEVK